MKNDDMISRAEIISIMFAIILMLAGFAFQNAHAAIDTELESQGSHISIIDSIDARQDEMLRQLIEDRGANRASWDAVKEQLRRILDKVDGN